MNSSYHSVLLYSTHTQSDTFEGTFVLKYFRTFESTFVLSYITRTLYTYKQVRCTCTTTTLYSFRAQSFCNQIHCTSKYTHCRATCTCTIICHGSSFSTKVRKYFRTKVPSRYELVVHVRKYGGTFVLPEVFYFRKYEGKLLLSYERRILYLRRYSATALQHFRT